MPCAVKKQVNAVELSGKSKPKCDLYLNGLPIQTRMTHNAYKQSKDSTSKGVITIYTKFSVDVFDKTSKSRMSFALAARVLGLTIVRCIRSHSHLFKHTSPDTFDSYLKVCEKTDRPRLGRASSPLHFWNGDHRCCCRCLRRGRRR